MEDSFDIGTIKETNEEYYNENDENADRGYPVQRYSHKGNTKTQTQSRHSDGDNVLRDRTNKVVNRNVEAKSGKSKKELEKGSKNKNVTNYRGGKANKDEDSLSSLSGFSGSDNEEPRFKQTPDQQYVQQELEADEEEEDEVELRMPPQKKSKDEELQERFRYYEDLRRKAEEEKRLNPEQQVNKYKRPQTAGGIEKDTRDIRSSHTHLRQEHQVSNAYSRPQTANPYREETEGENQEPIIFKPVYTKPYHQHLIEKKKFNYSLKRFNTLPKKSDPVSRFNAFKTEWNKTKFLKSNSGLLNGRNPLLTTYDKTYVKTASTKKF